MIYANNAIDCGTRRGAVLETYERFGYSGEIMVWPPIECGGRKGVWLVVVGWRKCDQRGNRFSQVIACVVWGDKDGSVKFRPYHESGPCVSLEVDSFNFYPDYDKKIHLQLEVRRKIFSEFVPPWEDGL